MSKCFGSRPGYVRLTLVAVSFLVLAMTTKTASFEASSVFEAPASSVLQVGEVLEYNVGYAIFHLGRIIVKIVDRFERHGRIVYKARAIIDSAPGLPFVNLHIRFESEFDEELYSYSWTAEDSSTETIVRRIDFDYDSSRVFVTKGKKQPDGTVAVEKIDTVRITEKCQDGFSLFYFARNNVRKKQQMNVPTFIEKEQVNTFFNFTNELSDEDIDSVKYPIEVVKFDGRADFVGVFGLTGGFRGWFSNDEAGIPIVARMNVILGSIKVELDRWYRPGWVAPKYIERD